MAGDKDRLELKLDTDDEDEEVFFLSVTFRPGMVGALPPEWFFPTTLCVRKTSYDAWNRLL